MVAPLSDEKVRSAAKAGLVAAATKAKLFADHEEREIQRLSANIINHQVYILGCSLSLKTLRISCLMLLKSLKVYKKWSIVLIAWAFYLIKAIALARR